MPRPGSRSRLANVRDRLAEATSGMSLAASRPRRRWAAGLALGIAAAAIVGFGPDAAAFADAETHHRPIPHPCPEGDRLLGRMGLLAGWINAGVHRRRQGPVQCLAAAHVVDGGAIRPGNGERRFGLLVPRRKVSRLLRERKALARERLRGSPSTSLRRWEGPRSNIGTWGADGQILFPPKPAKRSIASRAPAERPRPSSAPIAPKAKRRSAFPGSCRTAGGSSTCAGTPTEGRSCSPGPTLPPERSSRCSPGSSTWNPAISCSLGDRRCWPSASMPAAAPSSGSPIPWPKESRSR